MGRRLGEALWPDRYPVPVLLRRKQAVSLALGSQVWDAQFQQHPKPRTGGMCLEDQWGTIVVADIPAATRWVRGWDLAATEDDGDWTVGALLGLMPDGRTVVADVVRGRWNSDRVRAEMRGAADHDPPGTHVELPQDPGQVGKDQGQQLVRHLAGHSARALPQTGSKTIRATPFSAQQQAGNVLLLEGAAWRTEFIAEHTAFPKGSHDDQVDAAATAFNALVRAGGGDGSGEWQDHRLQGRR